MEKKEFEYIARRIRLKALDAASACSVGADAAADVAQDVMLRLWTLHDDIADAVHAERLAVKMARHMVIDSSRTRHTVTLNVTHSLIDENNSTPDVSLEYKEDTAWLLERMKALPAAEYQILRLRQEEQLENGEIAALLGMEKTSVATLLSRARIKLLNDIKRRIKA